MLLGGTDATGVLAEVGVGGGRVVWLIEEGDDGIGERMG